MSALRRTAPLVALLAAEAAAVAVLHALGAQPWAQPAWHDPAGWLAGAAPVATLVAVLRLVGLAVGWWLLATTVLTAIAALAGADGLAARVRPLTLSLARTAADRAAAAGVSAALVLPVPAPALADDQLLPPPLGDPAVVEPRDRRDAPPPAERSDAPIAHDGATPSADPAAPEGGDGAREIEVTAGDHLWALAAADLASRRGVDPAALATRDVAAHWRQVVDANAGHLRSGDPDLVYPGERIVLPPP